MGAGICNLGLMYPHSNSWELEAKWSEVQGHHWLCREFKTSQGYMRPFLSKNGVGSEQAMYSKEKKRQEKRAERFRGEEKRARDVEDLEERIPGEKGSQSIKTERRKLKMGELVESRQMFKADRNQSHREGSIGNGRRRERPHET